MARLLSLFLIFAVVMGQGTSMAQALCRHQSARGHFLARESGDAKAAAVSLREEAAAAAASKKGSQSGDSSSQWPAEMLPAQAEVPMQPKPSGIRPRPVLQAVLPSATLVPLLKPPSA